MLSDVSDFNSKSYNFVIQLSKNLTIILLLIETYT